MRRVLPRPRQYRLTFAAGALGILMALAAASPATVGARQDDARPMTVDDALRLARIGNVTISPAGAQVFYSVSELDWDENKRRVGYYMVPFSGGEAREYIGEAGGEAFYFSPDGGRLTFLRDVEDEAQIFSIATAGGEAQQLTNHAGGIKGYRWAPDGGAIFFSADEALSNDEQREHDLGFDPLFVDEAPNGKHEARFRNLWVHDIEADEETRLTSEELIVGAFDVSPDGQRIVLSARADNRTNLPVSIGAVSVRPSDRAYLVEEIRWFKKYVDGVDWEPWELPQ